jgi:hypothetical protein
MAVRVGVIAEEKHLASTPTTNPAPWLPVHLRVRLHRVPFVFFELGYFQLKKPAALTAARAIAR